MKQNSNKHIPFEDFTDEQLDDFLNYAEPFTDEHQQSIQKRFIRERDNSSISMKKIKSKKSVKSWTVILSVALFLIILGAFSNFSTIKKMYYKLFGTGGETIFQKSDVVKNSIEFDGFKLQVLRSFRDEGRTFVLAELSDIEGNRLDENTSIIKWKMNDSYGGKHYYGFYWFSDPTMTVDFDKKNQSTIFMIDVTDSSSYKNDYILTLEEFASGSIKVEETIPFDFNYYLEQETNWSNQDVWLGDPDEYILNDDIEMTRETALRQNESRQILIHDEKQVPLSDKMGLSLSNIGYTDDLLHMQLINSHSSNRHQTGVALKNKQTGDLIFPVLYYNLERGNYKLDNPKVDDDKTIYYSELFFDIEKSELDNYELYLETDDYTTHQTGDWKIELEEPTQLPYIQLSDIEIESDGRNVILSNIKLSPISLKFAFGFRYDGLSVNEAGQSLVPSLQLSDSSILIKINMKNGEEITYDSMEMASSWVSSDNYSSQFSETSNSTMQYYIDYIDIDDVESVSFNGVETEVKTTEENIDDQ